MTEKREFNWCFRQIIDIMNERLTSRPIEFRVKNFFEHRLKKTCPENNRRNQWLIHEIRSNWHHCLSNSNCKKLISWFFCWFCYSNSIIFDFDFIISWSNLSRKIYDFVFFFVFFRKFRFFSFSMVFCLFRKKIINSRFSSLQISSKMSFSKQSRIQIFSIQEFRILQIQVLFRRFRMNIQSVIQFVNVQIFEFFNFDCICLVYSMSFNAEWKKNVTIT